MKHKSIFFLLLSFLLAIAESPAQRFVGMTNSGGASNGVIFEWDNGTNTYTKKQDFSGTTGTTQGSSPYFTDLVAYNGKFYGMTAFGGVNDKGVIFEWDLASNTYTKKVDLSDANGSEPWGSLTLYNNKFYGMTGRGGANNEGVIFEWDPATNTYTKKQDFDGTSKGSQSYGSLVLYNNKFYGVTNRGGANFVGVIFEWDPATNTYSKKQDLSDANGSNPLGNLSLHNNKFYGVTNRGGANSQGVIFEWDPASNTYSKKVDFDGASKGSRPYGNLSLYNNKFYGMTSGGGANSAGVIFEWDPSNNSYSKKQDLSTANGNLPYGNNLSLYNNKFYGMTYAGGADGGGAIFEWDPATNAYSKKQDLSNTNGRSPLGSLTLVCPSSSLSPAVGALAAATNGTAYSQSISQTGLGTVTWSVSAGTLPAGLSLNASTGLISGTPTGAAGSSNFTITATEGGCSASAAYSIAVSCPTISFTNTTASDATVGTAYNLDASATGNTATLSYSVSPALPAGLSLNTSTGLISGTPTATAASATYTVTASQSSGVCTASQPYTFAVACPLININPTTLIDALQFLPYSQTLSQSGLVGTPTWNIISGALPTGLSLNSSTGEISGTSSNLETQSFTVEVSDGTCSQTAMLSLTVAPSGAIIEIQNPVIDFGTVQVLQTGIATAKIKNVGSATLQINSFSSNNRVFSYGFLGTAGGIAPGETKEYALYFTPVAAQSYDGTYQVNSNAVAGANSIDVTGLGEIATAISLGGNSFECSPNPARDYLRIRSQKAAAYSYQIMSTSGKVLQEAHSELLEEVIALDKLPRGVYFLRLSYQKDSKTIKIVLM
ncbi:MAG: putative Ig domain-containing protein [Thermonemataceae bacterium]|nr:putative Ig domain-containing protein [Thermonemataceae bacterium]